MATVVRNNDGSISITVSKAEVEMGQEVSRNKAGQVTGYKVHVAGGKDLEHYQTIDEKGHSVQAAREYTIGKMLLTVTDLGVQKDKKPTQAQRLDGLEDKFAKLISLMAENSQSIARIDQRLNTLNGHIE